MEAGDTVVSLLLAPDTFDIARGSGVDAHGWASGAAPATIATESGSIQPRNGASSRDMAARTGWDSGPNDPDPRPAATGYLQPDTTARPGDVLTTTAGERWRVLSLVRVADPTGGDLGCVQAALEAADG